MSATVGLLTSKQKLVISEFSQVLVHESSQYDQLKSSDDGQGIV